MKLVQTNRAPSAIGPYSQAVIANGMVYTSGQIALTADGSDALLKEEVVVQAVQVLKNLEAVLSEAGSSLDKVIKTTIFLANMDDFAVVNEVYAEAFGSHKPARSTVAVKTLPKNALVEIDAVALLN
ncbi:MAG: deaminase [Epsilonproteobacteria bacterium]|nr:deaminase [Campylobacterota bacterium]OIO13449.1 MAG: deaminase [Helicobacteraceae bacterium CG1_02_36_14]PIP11218.1 MAG: deaminase [Sulfurimonas sp. CG23_combo_of_CG06-09_8_20_14_all_36_33]PIS25886.1 MAG: deaminase [Sulfurimonas sp. CG08_land_8_20_14_0_20_36_33]PIU33680.1 MAG: deaminase [Sulfurimonas sp. CG07_land_8_20_14_0_80_36_56]PIV05701.1 MAG: deaminase [Sulfurimonas sp. CG03_land_8_20_14_0_80_36_25]PIV36369.1 MAG: deaminase [Sulfurimonas sp. CG02_land_8_20_14_3_00_36_67]PIV59873.1 